MPLFKKKGKVPARNIEAGASTINVKDLDDTDKDSGTIKLSLGDNKLVFEDGVWTSGGHDFLHQEILNSSFHNIHCSNNVKLPCSTNVSKYRREICHFLGVYLHSNTRMPIYVIEQWYSCFCRKHRC